VTRTLAVRLMYWLNLPKRIAGRAYRALVVRQFASVGKNFAFDVWTDSLPTPELTYVGNDVFFNRGVHLSGHVHIHDNVMLGPHVAILAGNHLYGLKGKTVRHARMTLENPEKNDITTVEADAWIGANSTVLGGLTVGAGAVVGAASVVTKDIPPYTVAVGNPCRPIRRIFDDATLIEHLRAISYDETSAHSVLRRRQQALAGQPLPVIDHTAEMDRETYYYHGVMQQPKAA
jgi:acetyltransferase-like isoleucine patch superfamily enzyme